MMLAVSCLTSTVKHGGGGVMMWEWEKQDNAHTSVYKNANLHGRYGNNFTSMTGTKSGY
uniref:Uncharacterized protein n=1 Tax=Rhizophagus irregularis (strain DAOM 181602 / DAOM 197198 / MUCL 43194) TaxID=747089 RepID=U9U7Q5_RHIID